MITSHSNPKIKQVRALRSRKSRQKSGTFLVEGIHHVREAAAASQVRFANGIGTTIEAIFYAPDLLTSEFAHGMIREQTASGAPCHAVNAEVFASMAEKENPQGILAVVRQREPTLQALDAHTLRWGVALVAPQDPGNLGGILRTMDAVGADGLILLDSSVDAFHPSAVRASMGALFWLPVVSAAFEEFEQWTRSHRYHVYGTSAHARTDYRQLPNYQRPLILLMGSEREGLTPEQAAICQELIRLPMHGRASSLNLAVAAGVMLYAMLER